MPRSLIGKSIIDKSDIATSKCPICRKRLRFLFPYNVDLSKNTPVVICSGCGTHSNVLVTMGALDKLGNLQFIFKGSAPQPNIERRTVAFYSRQTPKVGNPMLVELPKVNEGWQDTSEGGMAFYFLVPLQTEGAARCVCLAGTPYWPRMNVVVSRQGKPQDVDAVLLVGSTGQSFWSDRRGYFRATFATLTPEGKTLYNLLRRMYGKIHIVTLLDT